MSELYFDYVKARLGMETMQDPSKESFVIFKTKGEEVFVEDLYITPSSRSNGIFRQLLKDLTALAVGRGCKYMTASVIPSSNGSSHCLSILLAHGFKLLDSQQDFIIVKKSLL